jgi:ATP-binding cassette subfamily B protein
VAVKSEFTVANSYTYNRTSPLRWVISHVLRYWYLLAGMFIAYLIAYSSFAGATIVIGWAADEIISPTTGRIVLGLGLGVLVLRSADGILSLVGGLLTEVLAKRVERDSREELYTSLLGKSQAFHDRQRVGDVMARATDDTQQLATMISRGLLFLIVDMIMGFSVYGVGTLAVVAGTPDLPCVLHHSGKAVRSALGSRDL